MQEIKRKTENRLEGNGPRASDMPEKSLSTKHVPHILHGTNDEIKYQSGWRHLPVANVEWENASSPGDGKCTLKEIGEITCFSGKECVTRENMRKEYGVDYVMYQHGEPDFSPFRDQKIGTVEIDQFCANRTKNFYNAQRIIAARWGVSQNAVEEYMNYHELTWHECGDRKTLIAVPTRIHNTFLHSGGISAQKALLRITRKWENKSFTITRNTISRGENTALHGGMTMKRSHGYGRSKMSKSTKLDGGFDYKIMGKEAADSAQEYDEVHALGVKFESDKGKIEDAIDRVKASRISEADKRQMIAELEAALAEKQREYEEQVVEVEQELEAEMQEQIDKAQEAAEEAQEQADEMRKETMDAGVADMTKAAEAAEKQKAEYEKLKTQEVQRLQSKINQANIQRRSLRTKRLSGH